jgi:Ca2+-transporting ATPase
MGLFTNKYLNIAIPVSVLLLLSTVYVPFMQNVMQTSPLLLKEWAMIVPIASSVLFMDEIRKAWQAHRKAKLA